MAYKRNKYHVAPKIERQWRGKTYASKSEMRYAKVLWGMLDDGLLLEVVEQPRLWLGVVENVYVPDFLVVPWVEGTGVEPHPYYIDVKGIETATFKKNKRLWKSYGRLDLHIIKVSGKEGWRTTEIVEGGGG